MDRTCSKCGLTKSLDVDNFNKQRGGYRYNCKECDKIRRNRHHEKERQTPEAIASRQAYQQHLEECRRRKAETARVRLQRYKQKLSGTWRYFYKTRWVSINRRTINGNDPKWGSKPHRRYLSRGTELRMTREEFRHWCYINREEIEQMYRDGSDPTIDRRDNNGHYQISNLQILPRRENCRKDSINTAS